MNTVFLFSFAKELLGSDSRNVHAKLIDETITGLFRKGWESISEKLIVGSVVNEQALNIFVTKLLLATDHYIYNNDTHSATRLLTKISGNLNLPEFSKFPTDSVNVVMPFYQAACERCCKTISYEKFETILENLDWGRLPAEYTNRISLLIGKVYLMEPDINLRRKCKLWIERLKDCGEAEVEMLSIYLLMEYHNSLPDPGSIQQWAILERALSLKDFSAHTGLEQNRNYFNFSNRISSLKFEPDISRDKQEKAIIAECQEMARQYSSNGLIPIWEQAVFWWILASEIPQIWSSELPEFKLSWSDLTQTAIQKCQEIIIPEAQGTAMLPALNKFKAAFLINTGTTKEAIHLLKENLAMLKKEECWIEYLPNLEYLIQAYSLENKSEKAYEVMNGIMQNMLDSITRIPFEALLVLFLESNKLLERENKRPGISWAINPVYSFLLLHSDFMDLLDKYPESAGKNLLERYKKDFLLLHKLAMYNIRASLLIHRLQVQLLRTSAIYSADILAKDLATQFLAHLDDPTSPLAFMKADWKDSKDIAHAVRNKIINRCITIAKGDLPLAAEHLDFSYRNIRSYITFNEVNRLGFFLSERQTSSRSLEEGIRIMFHDLYLKGNIFESVFDMPVFLVKHSTDGFLAEEMETELEIKGSTAKKYLKIMCDIGLIEPSKSIGRKLHYRLSIDTIMHRYAETRIARI